MRRIPFPGGTYVDAWPDGSYVVLFQGSHYATHLGRVEFPYAWNQGPINVRCTPAGGFRFVGLGYDKNDRLWEWRVGDGWRHIDGKTSGRVVYSREGNIQDFLPAGYQFLSDTGEPIPRLTTYTPRHGISEWTETGGLLIGQGHEGGGIKVYDLARGTRHVLDTGHLWFCNVNRQGESVAISYWGEGKATIVQATLADLRALPLDAPPMVVPPPVDPVEPPMPTLPDPPARKGIVNREWARQPADGTPEGNLAFCRRVARGLRTEDPRWGLNWKRGKVGSPSTDIIAYRWGPEDTDARIVDILSHADDPAKIGPAWHLHSVEKAGTVRWYWEEQPDTEPDKPPPDDEVESPWVAVKELRAEIAALREQFADLQREVQWLRDDANIAEATAVDAQERVKRLTLAVNKRWGFVTDVELKP